MRRGASKFDLRDDEWMMVEDEFLDTAKLFTRHLHIAEYEKLKERIEAKKKEQVEAARPVVDAGKLSFEGKMKEKTRVQEKRQRKALRDVFASQNDDDEDDDAVVSRSGSGMTASSFNAPSRASSTAVKQPPRVSTRDTDSDDLDSQTIPKPRAKFMAPSVSSRPHGAQSAARPQPQPASAPASITSSFAKPAPPAAKPKARSTVRRSRIMPFDDGYVAPTTPLPRQSETPSSQHSKSSARPSSPVKPTVTTTDKKAVSSVDVIDDWGARSRETTERLAKRKADREAAAKKKKKVELDEIPTFLF